MRLNRKAPMRSAGALLALGMMLSACAGSTSQDDQTAAQSSVDATTTTTTIASDTTTTVAAPATTAAPPAGEPNSAQGELIVNTRPFRTDFDALTPWIDGIGYIRVWGGSRGMATYPTLDAVPEVLLDKPRHYSVVTQAEIDGVLGLQRQHGVRVIYMVNVNDTLASQRDFIARLRDAGVDLAMLEMGNELYLNKFRNGDTSHLGVTRSWSAEQYVEMLEEWVPELRSLGVPIYVIGASHGTSDSAGDQHRREWNQVMRQAITERPNAIDGVTFHRYAGEERNGVPHEEAISNEGFAFLSTFGDLPIAITESGYVFSEMSPENLDRAAEFWTEFERALKPGDLYGVHVLYRPSGQMAVPSYHLFDETGRTPVGDRLAEWLSTG